MDGIHKVKSLFTLSDIIGSIDEHRNLLCFRESLVIGKFEDKDEKKGVENSEKKGEENGEKKSEENSEVSGEGEEEEDEHANQQPTPVGGMCLDIQTALDNKWVVYTSTKFHVNGSIGGSKISTWVDPYFYTIEEKRVEFIIGKDEEHSEKQTLYTGCVGDKLYVCHTTNDRHRDKKKYVIEDVKNLISEGANFIFMRYLARSLFEGCLEMLAIYINGDICRNIYQCLPVTPAVVNNVKTLTVKINRIIIEECGLTHYCSTVLTVDGHLVKQEWHECDYTIQLNPLQSPLAFALCDEVCGCEHAQNLVSNWQNDIELMSMYLDHRKLCEYKAKDYIQNTPELTDILADYVKTLLQHRPENVLDFTSNYFMRYGS